MFLKYEFRFYEIELEWMDCFFVVVILVMGCYVIIDYMIE